MRYIEKVNRPTPSEEEYADWLAAGSPSGLALKVYEAWLKGEMYVPTNDEFMKRSIKNGNMFPQNGETLGRQVTTPG